MFFCVITYGYLSIVPPYQDATIPIEFVSNCRTIYFHTCREYNEVVPLAYLEHKKKTKMQSAMGTKT